MKPIVNMSEESKENIKEELLHNVSKLVELIQTKSKTEIEDLLGKENIKDGQYTCKVCGKRTSLSNLKIFDTPVVKGVTAFLCPDCWKLIEDNKLWKIVCIGCKEFKQAQEPGINPKNGFEFKPGGTYHMLECPSCHPEHFDFSNKKPGDVVALPLIEELIYDEKLKKAYKEGSLDRIN